MADTSGAGRSGKIRAVKVYRAALGDAEVAAGFKVLDAVLKP